MIAMLFTTCIFNRYWMRHSLKCEQLCIRYCVVCCVVLSIRLFRSWFDLKHQMFVPNCLMQICIDNDINVLRLKAYARYNIIDWLICCWVCAPRVHSLFLFCSICKWNILYIVQSVHIVSINFKLKKLIQVGNA